MGKEIGFLIRRRAGFGVSLRPEVDERTVDERTKSLLKRTLSAFRCVPGNVMGATKGSRLRGARLRTGNPCAAGVIGDR
jgi:hypothetical protein